MSQSRFCISTLLAGALALAPAQPDAQTSAPPIMAPKHAASPALTLPVDTGGAGSPGGVGSSVSERGGKSEIALSREVFSYEAGGRRDPFKSLLVSGELRPMISDLKLVTILYDPTGRSVAILRDLGTKEQHRVRVGQTLGRMRVSQILPDAITFTIEEFGYSRQEAMALNNTPKARMQ